MKIEHPGFARLTFRTLNFNGDVLQKRKRKRERERERFLESRCKSRDFSAKVTPLVAWKDVILVTRTTAYTRRAFVDSFLPSVLSLFSTIYILSSSLSFSFSSFHHLYILFFSLFLFFLLLEFRAISLELQATLQEIPLPFPAILIDQLRLTRGTVDSCTFGGSR